jgi:hypothetical protein
MWGLRSAPDVSERHRRRREARACVGGAPSEPIGCFSIIATGTRAMLTLDLVSRRRGGVPLVPYHPVCRRGARRAQCTVISLSILHRFVTCNGGRAECRLLCDLSPSHAPSVEILNIEEISPPRRTMREIPFGGAAHDTAYPSSTRLFHTSHLSRETRHPHLFFVQSNIY